MMDKVISFTDMVAMNQRGSGTFRDTERCSTIVSMATFAANSEI
jgi:hypothetical protein